MRAEHLPFQKVSSTASTLYSRNWSGVCQSFRIVKRSRVPFRCNRSVLGEPQNRKKRKQPSPTFVSYSTDALSGNSDPAVLLANSPPPVHPKPARNEDSGLIGQVHLRHVHTLPQLNAEMHHVLENVPCCLQKDLQQAVSISQPSATCQPLQLIIGNNCRSPLSNTWTTKRGRAAAVGKDPIVTHITVTRVETTEVPGHNTG